MLAHVNVQDRAMRVPQGRSRLRVMPLSGAVCQQRAAPDLTGQDAEQGGNRGEGDGETKAAGGKVKGGQPSHQTPRTRPGRAANEIGEGKAGGNTATTPLEGEGTAGDDPGYTLTPEDLRLREVYRD